MQRPIVVFRDKRPFLARLTNLLGSAERISVAPQWQLMWWRFRKHKLALVSTAIVLLLYVVVGLADFLAYADPRASEASGSE